MANDTDININLKADRLEVRGKTLVIENSIYQIINISSIEVGTITRPITNSFWFSLLVVFGVLFYSQVNNNSLFGLLGLFGLAGAGFYFFMGRTIHGLIIRLNSGYVELISSPNVDFLKQIATVLRNVMDNQESKSITFNLDKRTIIDNVSNSAVTLGNVQGDIVNRV